MTNQYIDYREKLKDLYENIYKVDDGKVGDWKPISEGFAFFDWLKNIEKYYRLKKGLSDRDRISEKDVYDFIVKTQFKSSKYNQMSNFVSAVKNRK